MFEEYPDVLNTNEVMQILDITKNTLYELIHKGELPALQRLIQQKFYEKEYVGY